jgi:DNA-binding MarR family transcriptional regulator
MSADRHQDTACAKTWHILRLAHNAVADQLSAALDEACGISIHEFDVLLFLHLNGALDNRIQDLANSVPLSQPALSRLVARLFDRDLVERSPAPDDGRVIRISLTAGGRLLADRAVEVHNQAIDQALTGQLSGPEQHQLFVALNRIAQGRVFKT